jgi:thioredoxin:protein disulfide reductase
MDNIINRAKQMKIIKTLLISFIAVIASGCNQETSAVPRVLPVDQAFSYQISSTTTNQFEVNWKVTPGHYLYHDKISVKSLDPQIHLTTRYLSQPEEKFDPSFDKTMLIHHKDVALEGVIDNPTPLQSLKVEIKYQGCADIGVCYPPQTSIETIQLHHAEIESAPSANQASLFQQDLISLSNETELTAEQAFEFSIDIVDSRTIIAHWQIAPDHYLYKDKINFSFNTPDITVSNADWPAATNKNDPQFGPTQIYNQQLSVPLTLSRKQNASVIDNQLTVKYQGCAEKRGICFAPQQKTVTVNLPSINGETAPLAEQDKFLNTLNSSSWIAALAVFFGAGFLLSLTPCVYPMIPILSGIIAGQSKSSTTRPVTLTMTYVLSVACVYAIAGVLVAHLGANLQALYQDPWIISIFSLIFIALAMSMFGFYDLQLPSALQNKLAGISHSQTGGTLIGVAIMGALSALVVSPCVTAPMIGALFYISETGNLLFGGLALFTLSLGMSIPLIILGITGGRLLPGAGEWMNAVKAMFGILMLGMANWLASRILPAELTMFIWGLLLIIPAIYMGAIEQLQVEATGWKKLQKGLGLSMLIYGCLLLIGASSGNSKPFSPLQGVFAANNNTTIPRNQLTFENIQSRDQLNNALSRAQKENKIVMLDIYADWCAECKRLEITTFTDPAVRSRLQDIIRLKLDITHETTENKSLQNSLGLAVPPTQLFFKDKKELKRFRVVGYQDANTFKQSLNRLTQ